MLERISVCAALLALACSSKAPAGAEHYAAPSPLQWVDPARCVTPCSGPAASVLVHIDKDGHLAAAGAFQFLKRAQPALQAFLAASRQAGEGTTVSSAYRTYDHQLGLLQKATEVGRTARPGHSEHELGEAVDLHAPGSAGYAWLKANAADFGFALSYPKLEQKTTGYRYESWHFRYLGSAIAREIADSGITTEGWFRAHPGEAISSDCSDCPSDLSRADCGAYTADGQCVGTVLTWCFDGTLDAIDCSATSLQCGVQDGVTDCRP